MKKIIRYLRCYIIFMAVFTCTILAISPFILSTKIGNNFASKLLSNVTKNQIDIEKIELSWIKKTQTIKGFTASKNNHQQEEIEIKSIECEGFLADLLIKCILSEKLPKIKICDVKLTANLNNNTNSSQSYKNNKFLNLLSNIELTNGEAVLTKNNSNKIYFTEGCFIKNENETSAFVNISQNHLSGVLSLKYENDEQSYSIESRSLPCSFIDILLNNSICSSICGENLDLSLKLQPNDIACSSYISISSQNLNANFKNSDPSTQNMCLSGNFSTYLTQEQINKIFSTQYSTMKLSEKIKINGSLKKLQFIKNEKSDEDYSLNIESELTSNNISLTNKETDHEVKFTNFKIQLNHLDTTHIDFNCDLNGAEDKPISGSISMSHTKENDPFILNIPNFHLSDIRKTINPYFQDSCSLFAAGYINFNTEKWSSNVDFNSKTVKASSKIKGCIENFDITSNIEAFPQQKNIKDMVGEKISATIFANGKHGSGITWFNNVTGNLKAKDLDIIIKSKLGKENESISLSNTYLALLGHVNNSKDNTNVFSKYINFTDGSFSFNFDGKSATGFVKVNAEECKSTSSKKTIFDNFFSDWIDSDVLATPYERSQRKQTTPEPLQKDNNQNSFGTTTLSFNCTNISLKGPLKSKIKLDLQSQGFPLKSIQNIANNNQISFLLGNKCSFSSNAILKLDNKQITGDISTKIAGKNFEFNGSFGLDNTTLTQSVPSSLYLNIHPEQYKYLIETFQYNKIPPFTLNRPIYAEIKILQASNLELKKISYPSILSAIFHHKLIFDVDIPQIILKKNFQTSDSCIIKNITCSGDAASLNDTLAFKISGEIPNTLISQNYKSYFSSNGVIYNPNYETNVNNKISSIGKLELKNLPTKKTIEALPLNPKLRSTVCAILGDNSSAFCSWNISPQDESIKIDIKSSNLKASTSLKIEDNVIGIREPIELELTLSDAVYKTTLATIDPILPSKAFSDHPIKLKIDSRDLAIPIFPFDFNKLNIGNVILEPGKIVISNEGQIRKVLDFLKVPQNEDENKNLVEAWFSPIHFSLKNGVLYQQRFDLLLGNSVHIASWGNINIAKDKINMYLGISAPTIQKYLKISSLPKDELFQIKIKGCFSNLEADWSSAYTRIGVLVTKSGGQLGTFVGGIMEQIFYLFGDNPAPKPTTYPLPWEN